MKSTRIPLAAIVLLGASFAAAADKPLAVKTGQWEITYTGQRTGGIVLPPEVLAKMTPDQRARMEAREKQRAAQGPRTHVSKSCVKQEDLDKPFGKDRDEDCPFTMMSSTSTHQEAQVKCTSDGVTRTGKFTLDALSSTSIQAKMEMNSNNGKDSGVYNYTLTGKWLSPTCSAKDED